MHWNEEEDKNRITQWRELQKISKKRIENIINGKLIGTYGLGNERDLNDYKNFCVLI